MMQENEGERCFHEFNQVYFIVHDELKAREEGI